MVPLHDAFMLYPKPWTRVVAINVLAESSELCVVPAGGMNVASPEMCTGAVWSERAEPAAEIALLSELMTMFVALICCCVAATLPRLGFSCGQVLRQRAGQYCAPNALRKRSGQLLLA